MYAFLAYTVIPAMYGPSDQRTPAMYGHFCSAPKVSVHGRHYCTVYFFNWPAKFRCLQFRILFSVDHGKYYYKEICFDVCVHVSLHACVVAPEHCQASISLG